MRCSTTATLSLRCWRCDLTTEKACKSIKVLLWCWGKQSKSIWQRRFLCKHIIISKLPQRSCIRYNSGRRIGQVFSSRGRRWRSGLWFSTLFRVVSVAGLVASP